MKVKYKIWTTLAAAIIILLVVGVGNLFWKNKKEQALKELKTVKQFSLLEDNGKLFKSTDLSSSQKMLLIFTPDFPTQIDVNAFYKFIKYQESLEKKGIQVILISRGNQDLIQNFKRATRFKGRLLFDLSGTVGKLFGAWPTLEKDKNWTYALVGNDLRVYWQKISPIFLSFAEVRAANIF